MKNSLMTAGQGHLTVLALLLACWWSPNTYAAGESCRTTMSTAGGHGAQAVRWIVPDSAQDRNELDAWCGAVGPAVVVAAPTTPAPSASDEIVVVTWNVHVGAGDLVGFVQQLRDGRFTEGRPVEHFVLLLQEAYRQGSVVPADPQAARYAPRMIAPDRPAGPPLDIVGVSAALGLSLFYAPSMRNGPPDRRDEDRGNAILSTERLSDLAAIELPFERQRRVALLATVGGRQPNGEPWTLRLADAHFENVGGAKRLWILSIASRLKQARLLLRELTPEGHAIVGGDLNTWFGVGEPAYQTLANALPRGAGNDRRPTFGRFLRLDHLLFRIPDSWETMTTRLDANGSDHHPLLARIRMTPARENTSSH